MLHATSRHLLQGLGLLPVRGEGWEVGQAESCYTLQADTKVLLLLLHSLGLLLGEGGAGGGPVRHTLHATSRYEATLTASGVQQ